MRCADSQIVPKSNRIGELITFKRGSGNAPSKGGGMSLKDEIKHELLDWFLLVMAIGFLVWIIFWGIADHQPARYYGGLDTITYVEVQDAND